MGDMADGMIDGTFCECCGQFIGDPCGYPRKCGECKEDE